MSFDSFDLSLPEDFTNTARLFPLPNLVMYPGVLQGLHVFEPRYLKLLDDSIETDSLITMAVIQSDSLENLMGDGPKVYPTVCIGRIVTKAKLDDGRFNILLVGAHRARIIDEIETDLPYRTANIELLREYCDADEDEVATIRQEMVSKFGRYARHKRLAMDSIKHLLSNQLPFGLLTDLISYALSEPAKRQVAVLQTVENIARAKLVVEMLDDKLFELGSESDKPTFPPGFSLN